MNTLLDNTVNFLIAALIGIFTGTILFTCFALYDFIANPLTKDINNTCTRATYLKPLTLDLNHYTAIGTADMHTCRYSTATIYQSNINLTEQIIVCD